ncbi:MAG: hypothetical protein ACFCU5_19980 [Pleurocapsa sp.]
MIILIILINISITILNIYLAIKIWQLRQVVIRITLLLINCELYVRSLLYIAPAVIYQGSKNIHLFRSKYQAIQLQIKKIQQIILLLNWSYRLWRAYVK